MSQSPSFRSRTSVSHFLAQYFNHYNKLSGHLSLLTLALCTSVAFSCSFTQFRLYLSQMQLTHLFIDSYNQAQGRYFLTVRNLYNDETMVFMFEIS